MKLKMRGLENFWMSGVEKEDKSGKKWKAIKKNRKGLIAMNIGK